MSTRSSIAIIKEDGSVKQIYAHWDGYTSHNGVILFNYYRTSEKVNELIDLGNLSYLQPEVKPKGKHSYDNPEDGVTIFYHRDRNEQTHFQTKRFKDVESFMMKGNFQDYDYVFKENNQKWYLIDHENKKLRALKGLIKKEKNIQQKYKKDFIEILNLEKEEKKLIKNRISEKTIYGSGEVELTYLNKEDLSKMSDIKATSVHCFVVKDNEVLFTVNPRGIDIIGGHVEHGETNEQAMIREAKEEASIIPLKYEIVGAIQVDNKNNPEALKKGYPEKGYQLFYKINEYELLPFEQTHECVDRKWVKKDEVAELHHKWLKTHQAVLDDCLKQPKNKLKM